MSAPYTIRRADRAASTCEIGQQVFLCRGWDYGCASEDTRRMRLPHVSVTFSPDGDYPFFTIPAEDLEPQP